MKALLLIAHGSRRAESNDEIRALTQKMKTLAGGRFSEVESAFLELATWPAIFLMLSMRLA